MVISLFRFFYPLVPPCLLKKYSSLTSHDICQRTKNIYMNTPLHHHVKPGLVHFMAFPDVIKGHGEADKSLREILQDEYFEVVEITWIKNPAMRQEIKEMLATSAVEVKYGAQPRLLTQGLDLNSSDEAHRKKAVAEIKEAIDDAVEMGIVDVAILSGN